MTTPTGWVDMVGIYRLINGSFQRNSDNAPAGTRRAGTSSQPDLPAKPYGFFGVSMGASAGIELAARDERLGAVAADSAYVSLREAIAAHLKRRYPWAPRPWVMPLIGWTYRLRFGVWPGHVAPIEHINGLNPRPLLVIHGESDQRVPAERIRALYARAGGTKQIWLVKGAGHMGAYSKGAETYRKRLVEFFRAHLQAG